MDNQTVVRHWRIPRLLDANIRKTATALKLRPPEVARMALARGMIGLDTAPTTKPPAREVFHAGG